MNRLSRVSMRGKVGERIAGHIPSCHNTDRATLGYPEVGHSQVIRGYGGAMPEGVEAADRCVQQGGVMEGLR